MKNETIEKLIAKQKFAYIASVDQDGYPNMKAMLAPRRREGLKEFYFTTNTSSQRVAQYRKDPKAAIYFCDQRFYRGIMLKGKMEVIEDATTKKSIWQVGDRIYYPKGVTDPDYCVLKFTTDQGRWYSGFKTDDFTP
ncbi:pyridoxamine 5'-phosphate oxidase family protein [Candidatus Saccharibacteria bacterium]|nr:pyridoxamine 5'-phosphate oxidase family protein [Candidatus Saccharibacteria bacterium]